MLGTLKKDTMVLSSTFSCYDVDINKYIQITHTASGRVKFIELCDIREEHDNVVYAVSGTIYVQTLETEDETGNTCLDLDALYYYEDMFYDVKEVC